MGHLATLLLLAQSSVCCNDRLNPQSEADLRSLQRTCDCGHQEWNDNTRDKHPDRDEALPSICQSFGRQQLRIEKSVCRIPERFSPPKPNPGLGSPHSFYGKDNGGYPGDDRGAPRDNE
jgi:hypothetical protein